MNKRPLTVTTPTHGMGIGAYLGVLLLGVLNIFELTNATAILELLGPLGTPMWATCMTLGGGVAVAAASLAGAWSSRLSDVLRIEGAAATVVAVTMLLYLVSLIWKYGLWASPTTKIMAATLSLGALIRVVQIIVEVRRVERGHLQPEEASPAPLADPDDV